ncbi:MAG: isochorismatase family protein [Candidatus Bipolaricaulota bacterium]|nr:isochorismatase family protein [Candidatus Bipolaricaulota bacterium]
MKAATALLVIDVQTLYMEPTPMVTIDGDDLLAKCGRLIDAAHRAGVSVIYVRHLDPDSPSDDKLTQIHPAIAPQPGDSVVEKSFGSAFMRTDLEERLERLAAKSLVVCGLATFGCVNQTVFCAVCKGYDVTVASDAHGTAQSGFFPPAEIIREFNTTWERAGARVVPIARVAF